MERQTKRVDIFGSFLRGTGTPPVETAQSGPPMPSAASSPEIEKALLNALGKADAPVNVRQLVDETGTSPTQLLKILEDMETVKLVKRSQTGGLLHYSITALGKNLTG